MGAASVRMVGIAAVGLALCLVAGAAEAQRRGRPRPRPGAGVAGSGADGRSAIDHNPFDAPGSGAAPARGAGGPVDGGAAPARGAGAPLGSGGAAASGGSGSTEAGAGAAVGASASAGASGAAAPGGGAGAAGGGAGSPGGSAGQGAVGAGAVGLEGSAEDPEPAGPDLGPLKDELTAVMDDLVSTRARIATLGRQLFRTKIRIDVHDRSRSNQSLTRLVVSLDGAQVFRSEGGVVDAASGKRVFEGFAAPGPHAITVEVEARARSGETYRYVLRDSFRFEVVRDKLTEVDVLLDGDSEIAEDFPDDGEGEYDVRTRFRVATRDLAAR